MVKAQTDTKLARNFCHTYNFKPTVVCHQNRRSQGIISSTCWSSRAYFQLRNRLSPPGGRFFPLLELFPSNLATPSESPTPRSYICVILEVWQHDSRANGPSSGPPAAPQFSAAPDSPLAAVVATASPLFALLERLAPDQHASFLRVGARLPSHL